MNFRVYIFCLCITLICGKELLEGQYRRLPNAVAVVGRPFEYNLPPWDGSQQQYKASEKGKTVLPKWLSFDEASNKLLGVPLWRDKGTVQVEIQTRHGDWKAGRVFLSGSFGAVSAAMGSAASAKEDVTVAVACPALRDDDETKPMRFRGAKQEFYEQTMRIFSKNDMNNRHPGYAPDCSQLADVQVDHQLRKKIELSDRNFYRDPSRVQLQQEASYENRKVRMASLSPESSPKNRSRRGLRTSFGSDLRRNSSTGSMSPKSGRGGNSFAMSPTVSTAGSVRGRSGRRNSGTGSQQLGA